MSVTAVRQPQPIAGNTLARARVLAGYLAADSLGRTIPSFSTLPQSTVDALHERVGKSTALPIQSLAGSPEFGAVRELDVLNLLGSLTISAPSPINLTGFEWVEIAPLVAGALITPALPHADQLPDPNNVLELAAFCMLSFARNVPADVRATPPNLAVTSLSRVRLNLADVRLVNNELHVRYQLLPVVDPIRVLIADSRSTAVAGLEKLVALQRIGVKRALCLASYGYGVDALQHMPRIPQELLAAPRPPLMMDYLDDFVSLDVPVRAGASVAQLRADSFWVA